MSYKYTVFNTYLGSSVAIPIRPNNVVSAIFRASHAWFASNSSGA